MCRGTGRVVVVYRMPVAESALSALLGHRSHITVMFASQQTNVDVAVEWGLPTLSVATALHVLPAVLLQSLISLFMFYAAANTCGAQPPPQAAVRRGLTVEGLGLVFGSVWGSGVTTSPVNIGLMSVTGIVSRNTTQLAALMMIFFSHFTCLTSIVAKIPISFLTALHFCLHAALVSVG
ncbi:hypothetical protein J6590_022309 [Homalodisca vitripennis]|nr:hypothetical protein J6590_022309 [Homalodisca vitripennis]